MAASTNVAMPLPPDDDRGPGLLGFVYVLFAFTSLVLSARVFVRVRLRNLGLDDYFMVLAWVSLDVSLCESRDEYLN